MDVELHEDLEGLRGLQDRTGGFERKDPGDMHCKLFRTAKGCLVSIEKEPRNSSSIAENATQFPVSIHPVREAETGRRNVDRTSDSGRFTAAVSWKPRGSTMKNGRNKASYAVFVGCSENGLGNTTPMLKHSRPLYTWRSESNRNANLQT